MTTFDGFLLAAGGGVLANILRAVFVEPHRQTQARLARTERNVERLLAHFGLEDANTLSPQVQEFLRQGRKINAIKAYREETGAGLKEAKDAIEGAERSPV